MNYINIEIKARSRNINKIRKILESRKAEFKGIDHQIDTYFKINKGKLKLREGNIEKSLIYYERKEQKGPKQSNIILYNSPNYPSLKDMLIKSLGILVIVDKQREIYFIKNIKFHIDKVKGLGSFVEIEAIHTGKSIDKDKLLDQCHKYMKLFNIKNVDLITCSYSDLLLNTKLR